MGKRSPYQLILLRDTILLMRSEPDLRLGLSGSFTIVLTLTFKVSADKVRI